MQKIRGLHSGKYGILTPDMLYFKMNFGKFGRWSLPIIGKESFQAIGKNLYMLKWNKVEFNTDYEVIDDSAIYNYICKSAT